MAATSSEINVLENPLVYQQSLPRDQMKYGASAGGASGGQRRQQDRGFSKADARSNDGNNSLQQYAND